MTRDYGQQIDPPPDPGLALDAAELRRRGLLAPGTRMRCVISWRGPAGETVFSVAYEADMAAAARSWVRLRFVDRAGRVEAREPGPATESS